MITNYYDVLLSVQNPDNMEKLDELISGYEWETSVITPEIIAERKRRAIAILDMGETVAYKKIKEQYAL